MNVHEVFDVFTYPLIDLLNKQESCEVGAYFKQRGMVTGQTFSCSGMTFLVMLLTAVSYYKQVPHEDSLNYLLPYKYKYLKHTFEIVVTLITSKR